MIFKRHYSTSSDADVGTLYADRNLINRRNVTADVHSNWANNKAFALLEIKARIIAAAMEVLGMGTMDDVKCDDAFNYNCSFLNQGLLLMNFLDATSEGDGERTLRSWKFFLLHFKEEKSTQSKYALEALYLLFQVYALLPPDQAHKLVWNRTINNKGGLGHNVALDLDLEHDNNYLKQSIRNLGANVTPEAVLRISRSQKVTSQILLNLDKECKVKPKSGRHVSADYTKDLKTVVKAIAEERVFNYNPGRQYTCFQNFPRDSLSRLDCSKLFQWINRHKKNIELARKAR